MSLFCVQAATISNMHAAYCKVIIVPMMQLSHLVVCTSSSSWIIKRLEATDCAKQMHVSSPRQTSGQSFSPIRPEQGHAPPQHT